MNKCLICGKETEKPTFCSDACRMRSYHRIKKKSYIQLSEKDRGRLIHYLSNYHGAKDIRTSSDGISERRWKEIFKGEEERISVDEMRAIGRFYTDCVIQFLDFPIRELL
jgi:hypothetical protein